MEHKVEVTEAVYEQIDAIVAHIALDAPEAARRWGAEIIGEIRSLKIFPMRHGLAPEAQAVGMQVRQMMFGIYRVLYTVTDDVVTVHGVRHGRRQSLRPEELPKPT